ncbi:pentatricopeptide repeat-containing protein At5g50280, chloroplastic [Malania oleifera]|uniref:pentatricopeptide repeat-containing protein At5g50280, chloroplastic n=1 Tax=Malania oleifera TaxID=397392 RepID=UPI0025ADB160|nr:pentatricopeptide repeat-containing protein At5g50280, chloroplastic [Malania oleifera]
MALRHQCCFPSSSPLFCTPNSNPHSSPNKPPRFACCPKTPKRFSLSATPPSASSSTPIFLPLLQKQEEREQEEYRKAKQTQQKQEEDSDDPILRFFKTQSSTDSTPDPQPEGKVSLQKNRRSSWHLSFNPAEETENGFKEEEEEEMASFCSSSNISIEGIPGEILQIARNLPENSTLGEVLRSYEGRIGEGECANTLELMGREGLVMGCLQFFEWMRLQEPPLVTPRACSVLFPVLGRARMGEELMVLFRNLGEQFRNVHFYNAAISGLFCSGRYEDALKVYEEMETKNIQADHVTCSIVITVMRKNGQSAKDVWEFFERMNRKGVGWSLEVLGSLLKSFCNEGLKKEALIIQTEMEKKGILPNAIVYNTLMDAYGKSNRVEEAEGLFVEMKAKGITPTTASFNILMDAYSRRMQPEIIEKLLLEMEGMGLEPNVKSYTCLISAYGRQRKMSEKAADAFLRMKKVGIKPTSHSYTALIHAYSVSGWHEKAYSAFENMQREGIKPSIETYTALLDASRRAGDTEMLMKIWKLMISEKIEGTKVTFNILLDGFAKQGRYIEARDVISEFGKLGLQPTLMTYNMLINAYARGGQHSRVPQLLREMATLNLKPDSVTFSTIIYAFLRVRDFKMAFIYHKKMLKSGQVPDAQSYEKLRAILDVKAAIKNRKDKRAMLGIIKSSRGFSKQKKKGTKDEFWKNKKRRLRTNNFTHVNH